MLSALSIVSTLLSLLQAVTGYLRDRKLLEQGAAVELNKALQHANKIVLEANVTRQSVRSTLERNPSSLHDDDGFKRND